MTSWIRCINQSKTAINHVRQLELYIILMFMWIFIIRRVLMQTAICLCAVVKKTDTLKTLRMLLVHGVSISVIPHLLSLSQCLNSCVMSLSLMFFSGQEICLHTLFGKTRTKRLLRSITLLPNKCKKSLVTL